MKTHDNNSINTYPIYSDTVEKITDLMSINFPSKHFILFLAMDSCQISDKELLNVATDLIQRGLAYICICGPDCEKAHDAFDHANILWEKENNQEFCVMSTWHADETLEDALWFVLFNAQVEDQMWDSCSIIIVSMGNREWKKTIDYCLNDIDAFNDRMIRR